MIVVDAAAVPDFFSGARTRLRGLLGAYGQLDGAPPLAVRIARGSTLFDGVVLGAVRVEEVAPSGGPWKRALLPRRFAAADVALVRAARVWHSETIPPIAPRGVPVLLTLHDLRWLAPRELTGASRATWTARNFYARFFLPPLARAIAGVVTVSRSSAEEIESKLRVPRERIHVVANATLPDAPRSALTPAQIEALVAELGIAEHPFLLTIGHLERRKGLDFALDVVASARPNTPLAVARLVFVGEGVERAALAAHARRLGLSERVVFAGRRDDASVAALLDRAAALLFPSSFEGFGLPPTEARARGCPVVAAQLASAAEWTEAGDPLVHVLPRVVTKWAELLDHRLSAPRRAPHPRPTGRRWSDGARELALVYQRVLTSKESS